jgi:putative transposase
LSQLTKRVLETAVEAEMSDHLGYDKHHPTGRNHGNSRNGLRAKTVLTEIGPVEIEVPRDLDASFQPKIVKKRQRRLTGVDQIDPHAAVSGQGFPPPCPRRSGAQASRLG